MAEPWNHNIHYHGLILRAIPPGARRALDVGCGEGTLARQLRALVPHVTGIDSDPTQFEAQLALTPRAAYPRPLCGGSSVYLTRTVTDE